MNHGPLPERLRALPRLAPPSGGWNAMSARLAARRRNYAVAGGGFALAASIVAAVGLVAIRPDAVPPAAKPGGETVVVMASESSPELRQLISRSQALERELSSMRPQVAVWNTGRDSRALLLETELRRVDAQLNFAEADSAEALWRRRVQLMSALVRLHDTETEAPALQYASYQY